MDGGIYSSNKRKTPKGNLSFHSIFGVDTLHQPKNILLIFYHLIKTPLNTDFDIANNFTINIAKWALPDKVMQQLST